MCKMADERRSSAKIGGLRSSLGACGFAFFCLILLIFFDATLWGSRLLPSVGHVLWGRTPPRLTLFEEAERMMLVSFCAYSLAELRREAKAGNLKESKKVLHLLGQGGSTNGGQNIGKSLAVADLLEIIDDNRYYLKRKYGLYGLSSFDVVRRIDERRAKTKIVKSKRSITLEDYNDSDEGRKLVYGIAMDRNERRITLFFRGTYPKGTNDWTRNLQFDMRKCPTPPLVLEDDRAPQQVLFHRGYYEYMFDNQDHDHPKERYDEILDHLKKLFKKHRGFKLYITGHSLGGALGTMTAFYLASSLDPDIPKPITVFTFGSPMAGDESFRAAYQILESKGLIRHLRVSNYEDMIPKGLPFSVVDKKLYKHVGVDLVLYNRKPWYEIGYKRVWPAQRVPKDGVAFPKFTLNPGRAHDITEYLGRILDNFDRLKEYELDDFYPDF